METMEDLEAEEEEEEVRLNGCGSSKDMIGVLESNSCLESPKRNEICFDMRRGTYHLDMSVRATGEYA